MGDRFAGLEPARRIEMEALDESRGARPELGRERGEDLQPGGRDDRPEPELGRGSGQPRQEERLGLVGGHPGQPGPVAIHQADPAVRPAFGIDRDPSLAERLDVAMDRPDRDLELIGQLARRQLAAGLEEEEQRDEAGGAHRR